MENGVRRWLVKISDWNPTNEKFKSIVSFFPLHEQSAISRFMMFEDKKRALVSRLLQYSLAHEIFSIPYDKIAIHRTNEGKPYLVMKNSLLPNFNFNISHHGNYVGIASEPMCLVGMDIMSNDIPKNESALDFLKNFASYFTNFEWKYIYSAGDSSDILAMFYRYWSLKEAFVKAIGSGIGFGLHRLEFHHTNWASISVKIDGLESRDWTFSLSEIDDKHWASVAVRHHKEGAGINMSAERVGFILRTVEELIRGMIDE